MGKKSPGKHNEYFIQSIDAATKVAESFLISGKEVLTLREMIEITGFTKNRVFRIISTLTDLGYLYREENGTGYSLGAKFLLLGEQVRNRSNLREMAAPFLEDMVEATNDAAHLYTTMGNDLVCILHRIGSYMVQAAGHVGEHIPIHIGPAKVILANKSEEEIHQYLAQIEITPFTDATVTDKDVLREELEVIRAQGYCVDHEEFEEGCHAFSAAVRDLVGDPIGAFVLAVPTIRHSEEKEHQVIQLTSTAAKDLSAQLGFQDLRNS
jgi:DNA-binding IclR family transcriptional regulator